MVFAIHSREFCECNLARSFPDHKGLPFKSEFRETQWFLSYMMPITFKTTLLAQIELLFSFFHYFTEATET